MSIRFYHHEYLGEKVLKNPQLCITHELFHYITRVRRFRAGDGIVLFDGSGYEYPANIERVDKKALLITLNVAQKISRELSQRIVLGIALLNADKMNWVIQKTVELGVAEIQPLITTHTNTTPIEVLERRLKHWNAIIISACEQCGRNILPKLNHATHIKSWLAKQDNHAAHWLADFNHPPLTALLDNTLSLPDTIYLAFGPEGGFTQTERQMFEEYHWKSFSLGKRTLRTETATLATLGTLASLSQSSP